MNTSKTDPSVTAKYHIEVPTQTYGSPAAVYKVWFGKSYFIWKGKALLQSATWLAESIERALRKEELKEDNYLWHVYKHIKKTRCLKAHIEVLGTDFIKEGTDTVIDAYEILRLEQRLLHEAKGDPLCLNNNEQAYVPKWMQEEQPKEVSRFLNGWKR